MSDESPIEILFTQGGDRNIDPSKYGNKELLLPIGQTLMYDGVFFSNESGFSATRARSYIADSDGFSIYRYDKPLSIQTEGSLSYEIYPSVLGYTSTVIRKCRKEFYDIVDRTIPTDLNYENYIIAGEKMTIIFQSGMLAGKEFEVKYIHTPSHDENGEEIEGKRFEIVPQK